MAGGLSRTVGGAQRRGRRRRSGAPMAEINITPFVDVMLVLLIIFMVAAPLLATGVPINLPKTRTSALPIEPEPPVAVNVDADGVIYIGDEPIELEALRARLVDELAARSDEKVDVNADGALTYEQVMRVVVEVKESGFSGINLKTVVADPAADGEAAAADAEAAAASDASSEDAEAGPDGETDAAAQPSGVETGG